MCWMKTPEVWRGKFKRPCASTHRPQSLLQEFHVLLSIPLCLATEWGGRGAVARWARQQPSGTQPVRQKHRAGLWGGRTVWCRSHPLMAGQPDGTFPCACVDPCLLQVGSQGLIGQRFNITDGWAVWLEHHSPRLYRLAMASRSAIQYIYSQTKHDDGFAVQMMTCQRLLLGSTGGSAGRRAATGGLGGTAFGT